MRKVAVWKGFSADDKTADVAYDAATGDLGHWCLGADQDPSVTIKRIAEFMLSQPFRPKPVGPLMVSRAMFDHGLERGLWSEDGMLTAEGFAIFRGAR